MILVAGGTGTLGTPLVRALVASGAPVRVLSRTAAPAVTGVEAVIGDVRDPETLARACAGCAGVVSAVHGFTGGRRADPAAVDRDANIALVRAAAEARVEHVVLVSVYGASPTHPMILHRMKYAAEQALAGTGLRWTAVRPAPFMETWIDVIGAQIPTRGRTLVFGDGDNPINFVSARDVADVIVRALRDEPHRDGVVDVTGPENLTLGQIAARLAAASVGASSTEPTRHAPRAARVPRPALRVMSVLGRPVAPAFARLARAAVHMDTADMTAGDDGTGFPRATLDEVIAARSATG